MRKETVVSSILCLFAFVLLTVVVRRYPGKAQYVDKKMETLIPSISISPTPNASASAAIYSLTDVKQHDSVSDCWQVIDSKVYNLTSFLEQHPGGSVITEFCGQDATKKYYSIKDGQGHPDKARQLLVNYYIGTIK